MVVPGYYRYLGLPQLPGNSSVKQKYSVAQWVNELSTTRINLNCDATTKTFLTFSCNTEVSLEKPKFIIYFKGNRNKLSN